MDADYHHDMNAERDVMLHYSVEAARPILAALGNANRDGKIAALLQTRRWSIPEAAEAIREIEREAK